LNRAICGCVNQFEIYDVVFVGWNSSVGLEIRYGMDGPGIKFRVGRGLPHPCRPALGPT